MPKRKRRAVSTPLVCTWSHLSTAVFPIRRRTVFKILFYNSAFLRMLVAPVTGAEILFFFFNFEATLFFTVPDFNVQLHFYANASSKVIMKVFFKAILHWISKLSEHLKQKTVYSSETLFIFWRLLTTNFWILESKILEEQWLIFIN